MTSSSPQSFKPATGPVPEVTVPDAVQSFVVANGAFRGRLVRLGTLADALVARKNLGAAGHLGGQALALVAGLGTGLKSESTLSLQTKSDGPLSLMIADSTHDGALRLYMRVDTQAISDIEAQTQPRADSLLGEGYLAFTIDQGPGTDRQQGIVAIEGATLADMAEHYFTTSEQNASSIHLFSRFTERKWDAGALILERIGQEGGVAPTQSLTTANPICEGAEDAWETGKIFAATLSGDELFNPEFSAQDILFRLFGTMGTQLSPPSPARFSCRCSREKLESVLQTFPVNDLDDMAEQGVITMSCEFCGSNYRFTRANILSHSR